MCCTCGGQRALERAVVPLTLSMIITDMGNGVRRIEKAQLLDVGSPRCEVLGWTPLSFPLPAWIDDAMMFALASMGILLRPAYSDGYFRSLAETMTEFFIW